MKRIDKNKIEIILVVVALFIMLLLGRVTSNNAIDDCVESGNSRDFCESGLLR